MANGNPTEDTVVEYLERRVKECGGGTRPLQYRGRRGCADQLVVFKFNRIFLVELKRPKGGKISIHQSEDCEWLDTFGIQKVYLFTNEMVDIWLRKVKP